MRNKLVKNQKASLSRFLNITDVTRLKHISSVILLEYVVDRREDLPIDFRSDLDAFITLLDLLHELEIEQRTTV